jgi:RNA polymerase sigma-70 factor (ECF subfamily)
VVQDVLEETLKRAPSSDFEHGEAFLGYARRTLQTRLPEVTQKSGFDQAGDASPSPIEEAIGREKLERYETAFQRLELTDQAAIAGRLEAGMAYEEIAEELGMPDRPAARLAVGRALLRFAREIRSLACEST